MGVGGEQQPDVTFEQTLQLFLHLPGEDLGGGGQLLVVRPDGLRHFLHVLVAGAHLGQEVAVHLVELRLVLALLVGVFPGADQAAKAAALRHHGDVDHLQAGGEHDR